MRGQMLTADLYSTTPCPFSLDEAESSAGTDCPLHHCVKKKKSRPRRAFQAPTQAMCGRQQVNGRTRRAACLCARLLAEQHFKLPVRKTAIAPLGRRLDSSALQRLGLRMKDRCPRRHFGHSSRCEDGRGGGAQIGRRRPPGSNSPSPSQNTPNFFFYFSTCPPNSARNRWASRSVRPINLRSDSPDLPVRLFVEPGPP